MEITEDMKNADYSHLEGKLIEFNYSNGSKVLVVVAGFDYYIGLTLKRIVVNHAGKPILENNDDFIIRNDVLCYNGESSPTPDSKSKELGNYDYDKFFAYAICALESGSVSQKDLEEASNEKNGGNCEYGHANCGFSA